MKNDTTDTARSASGMEMKNDTTDTARSASGMVEKIISQIQLGLLQAWWKK